MEISPSLGPIALNKQFTSRATISGTPHTGSRKKGVIDVHDLGFSLF
jgi:hypothetical protein